MGNILFIGYVVGVLLAVWPTQQLILNDTHNPDSTDKTLCGILAFLFSLMWPITVVGFACVLGSKKIWKKILSERNRVNNGTTKF